MNTLNTVTGNNDMNTFKEHPLEGTLSLTILRGFAGSGKTSLAKSLAYGKESVSFFDLTWKEEKETGLQLVADSLDNFTSCILCAPLLHMKDILPYIELVNGHPLKPALFLLTSNFLGWSKQNHHNSARQAEEIHDLVLMYSRKTKSYTLWSYGPSGRSLQKREKEEEREGKEIAI